MRLTPVQVACERQSGSGAEGLFQLGDCTLLMPALLKRFEGRVQLIYIDPPFATKQQFVFKQKLGEKDWKSGNGSLSLPAYSDCAGEQDYLSMMRAVLMGVRELLSDTGTIFLHIDFRMHAKLRLLMDEIFGEENFLNEIIWAYQTGGRARRYFSRKHDVILFYRKTKHYFFDADPIATARQGNRRNHMKRHVDTDGRVYRSIKSGGKIYTYYDDELVYPGDVWDDVSHLQQRDPQRTGYDTQKPLALLNRIICCASREGDLVMDLFAGSGTTLASAQSLGRRFVGVDKSPLSMQVIRRRLRDANVSYEAPPSNGNPLIVGKATIGVGYYEVTLETFSIESGLLPRVPAGFDALDDWSVGYMRDGAYQAMAHAARTKENPQIRLSLELPVLSGQPMLRAQDILGRSFFYELQMDEPGEVRL